jgi:hypothetical protein
MQYRGIQYEIVQSNGTVRWTVAAGTVDQCSGKEATKAAAVVRAMTAIDDIRRRNSDALKSLANSIDKSSKY